MWSSSTEKLVTQSECIECNVFYYDRSSFALEAWVNVGIILWQEIWLLSWKLMTTWAIPLSRSVFCLMSAAGILSMNEAAVVYHILQNASFILIETMHHHSTICSTSKGIVLRIVLIVCIHFWSLDA